MMLCVNLTRLVPRDTDGVKAADSTLIVEVCIVLTRAFACLLALFALSWSSWRKHVKKYEVWMFHVEPPALPVK